MSTFYKTKIQFVAYAKLNKLDIRTKERIL